MQPTPQLNALFTLIDDPDQDVYETVSNKIVEYGKLIIPNLEELWETTLSPEIQQRIEQLIHRLQYTDLTNDIINWRDSPYHDLLFGSLIVSKFQYPDLQTTPVLQEIEKIRRNIWLELNSFLTPLEQAHVLTSIVYNYYRLTGTDIDYTNPEDFFVHKVIQTKKGNALSNGIFYLLLCELLGINVKAINIPKQFVLAFFHDDYDAATYKGAPQQKIHFYIDAINGQVFSQKEVDAYFKRIQVPPTPSFFKPLSHQRIIQMQIEELAKCYTADHNQYKSIELMKLAELLG